MQLDYRVFVSIVYPSPLLFSRDLYLLSEAEQFGYAAVFISRRLDEYIRVNSLAV